MGPIDAKERQISLFEPLELHLLPEEGLAFDEPVAEGWLDAQVFQGDPNGLSLAAAGPGRARLTVTPVGAVETRPPIHIRGRLEAQARTTCVRCLEDVTLPLETELETTLMFARAAPTSEATAEPTKKKGKKKSKKEDALEEWDEAFDDPSALDDGAYTAEGIDLASILREGLLLALEMNPTCEDEAACDTRTEALLAEANRPFAEAEAAGDPRWAALAALRKEN